MSIFAYVTIALIVAPLAFLVWMFAGGSRLIRKNIETNLQGTRTAAGRLDEGPRPTMWLDLARRVAPKGYVRWLDRKLAQAGRPADWPLDRVVAIKPLLALAGFLLGGIMALAKPMPQTFLLLIVLTVLFYFLPDVLIKNHGDKRRLEMQIALPTMLDQMLISVEAGVGFESAMARAAESSSGPLKVEFVRTLQDIQVGRSRREAYLDLAQRANFPDLKSFVRAVVQADQYGIAIAKVLRAQAHEMRLKRRQRAEEQAMKIPVKILFPLIFVILPALFIIVLGPAVFGIIQTFQ
ncbi:MULTISPECIES: type II secretion system F family protein [Arthrobacter]|uniref:Type II secretion system F family protein n=2 Tax=Arthrobacter TaxID=1663 RepID=A0ABU9KFV4_9MICC|nr:type II secretion system F family protein [Arthrobacter sp. YJM1]MDP5225757.1 type II secretion system F family protein [Arthrobacter sp. YJM1]